MAFLFDTDAISEVLRRRPLPGYVRWLSGVPRAEQFTSAVVVGELYGALQAQLEAAGRVLADADLQIAATAVHHDLELVTGNLRHFRQINGLPWTMPWR